VSTPLEPLRFQRHFVEKVWGGRALESTPGIELPPKKPIGETWEIVDREKENSIVAEGAFRGQSLRQLMLERGPEILGSAPAGKHGRFPLLVKYLDANQNLSVQVHPDDATAARMGGSAEAKTEAWYVLDAQPGGLVYAGLQPEIDAAAFERLAPTAGIVKAMCSFPVHAGHCILLRGGTVHAIGAGVTILEVQQNSDSTYRVYDWGRNGLDGKPRQVHLEQALECAHYGDTGATPQEPVWEAEGAGLESASLAESHVFRMQGLRVSAPVDLDSAGEFRIYSVVGGSGKLLTDSGAMIKPLARGDVWLLPAVCGIHSLAPDAGGLQLVAMGHA